MIIIAGIFEVLFWIIAVLVAIGAIAGILAFVGLRKLWRFVGGVFDDDGRPGPGNPPLSRRSSTPRSEQRSEVSSSRWSS